MGYQDTNMNDRKSSLSWRNEQTNGGAERTVYDFKFDVTTPEFYHCTVEDTEEVAATQHRDSESVGSRACSFAPTTPNHFPPCDAFGDTIKVTVGESPDSRTWTLHKDVLAFYSTYFQAALFGWFAEAGKDSLHLPDEEPAIFAHFVRWLYTRQIDTLPLDATHQDCEQQSSRPYSADCAQCSPYRALIDLHLFADRRGIPLLMNSTLDALKLAFLERWDSLLYDLPLIYANTVPSSGLRRLEFDLVSNTDSRTKCFKEGFREGFWTEEMLWDVARFGWGRLSPGGRRMVRGEVERGIRVCEGGYHVHEGNGRCEKR